VAEPVVDRLSSSRSIIRRQNPRPERAQRAISRSIAAKKKLRLKSPVSGSTADNRMAASRARRCSRAMTVATYASRTRAVRLTMTIAPTAVSSIVAFVPSATASR